MFINNDNKTDDNLAIGDVSRICQVPVHTIRYWESEFREFLQPTRTVGKQRRYTDTDIQRIMRLKGLLWNQHFSIRAVKRILSAGGISIRQASGAQYHAISDTQKTIMRLAQLVGSGGIAVSEQLA